MKPIRLTNHALEQCIERGTNESEVKIAVEQGSREPAKKEGRCVVLTSHSVRTGKGIFMQLNRLQLLLRKNLMK